MKRSELLKKVLVDFDTRTIRFVNTSPYMCDRIRQAGTELNDYSLAISLVRWISKHLGEDSFSVRDWLRSQGYAIGYGDYDDEMKEYRRLWLINMIAYWESKEGE